MILYSVLPRAAADMAATAEDFFSRLPLGRLSETEAALLSTLEALATAARTFLPAGVTVQEWADRRMPPHVAQRIRPSGLVWRSDVEPRPNAEVFTKHESIPLPQPVTPSPVHRHSDSDECGSFPPGFGSRKSSTASSGQPSLSPRASGTDREGGKPTNLRNSPAMQVGYAKPESPSPKDLKSRAWLSASNKDSAADPEKYREEFSVTKGQPRSNSEIPFSSVLTQSTNSSTEDFEVQSRWIRPTGNSLVRTSSLLTQAENSSDEDPKEQKEKLSHAKRMTRKKAKDPTKYATDPGASGSISIFKRFMKPSLSRSSSSKQADERSASDRGQSQQKPTLRRASTPHLSAILRKSPSSVDSRTLEAATPESGIKDATQSQQKPALRRTSTPHPNMLYGKASSASDDEKQAKHAILSRLNEDEDEREPKSARSRWASIVTNGSC